MCDLLRISGLLESMDLYMGIFEDIPKAVGFDGPVYDIDIVDVVLQVHLCREPAGSVTQHKLEISSCLF